MKNLLSAAMVLLFFASCTSSKIYTSRTCMVCLKPEDGVLVVPLAWDASFQILSVGEKNQIERQLIAQLNQAGFPKVELLDQLDYELLREGIKDLNDPIQREKIHSRLGYSYLLALRLGPTRAGEFWDFQTPEQVYELAPDPDMEVSSILQMALISTQTGAVESDFSITSTNSGFGKRDEADGMDYYNFAELSGVIQHGVGKGIAHLVKACGC